MPNVNGSKGTSTKGGKGGKSAKGGNAEPKATQATNPVVEQPKEAFACCSVCKGLRFHRNLLTPGRKALSDSLGRRSTRADHIEHAVCVSDYQGIRETVMETGAAMTQFCNLAWTLEALDAFDKRQNGWQDYVQRTSVSVPLKTAVTDEVREKLEATYQSSPSNTETPQVN